MRPVSTILLAALLLGPTTSRAETAPHMMSDGAEYCGHLNREIFRLQNSGFRIVPMARWLSDEGNRMCDRGQYRAGIARLRRALMLMRTVGR